MKKLIVTTMLVALIGAVFFAVPVGAGSTALSLWGAKYGVTEIQTSGTAHNVNSSSLTGRPEHLRFVYKITQLPATAANTAIVAFNPTEGAAFTLFTLAEATHDQTTIAELTDQQQYQVGSTNVPVVNARGVLLRSGDTMTLTGSTNSVVRYRIEHADIPLP